MDRDVAISINENVEAAMSTIFRTAETLKDLISIEHFKIYTDMVGKVMLYLDPGVLEWVYRSHPDLRPVDLLPLRPFGPDV